jgi:hypothetical protein
LSARGKMRRRFFRRFQWEIKNNYTVECKLYKFLSLEYRNLGLVWYFFDWRGLRGNYFVHADPFFVEIFEHHNCLVAEPLGFFLVPDFLALAQRLPTLHKMDHFSQPDQIQDSPVLHRGQCLSDFGAKRAAP